MDIPLVALVDDDVTVLNSMSFLLDAAGFQAVTYNSTTTCLEDKAGQATCLIIHPTTGFLAALDLIRQLHMAGISLPTLLFTDGTSPGLQKAAGHIGIEVVQDPVNAGAHAVRFVERHHAHPSLSHYSDFDRLRKAGPNQRIPEREAPTDQVDSSEGSISRVKFVGRSKT
jgi:DNA-binding NtrC family response regulator